MSPWPSRLLIVAAVLFLLGWGLVFVSGYGGNSTGGSELVWRVGGLMVYASLPTLLMAGRFLPLAPPPPGPGGAPKRVWGAAAAPRVSFPTNPPHSAFGRRAGR